jgi:ATP-dependent DNA helicase RecG
MSHKNEVQEAYGEGEGQYVEFKENTDSKKIGETVSAFANTNDGIIIIGVRDRTKEITGIEIGKGTLESIANTVKTNTDPKIFPAWIESCKFERKSVIAIKIKENDEKPVFYNGKTFKRVGKTNQKMSVSEMKKLLSESRRMYFDGQICEDATLEEIDEEKVGTYLEKKKEPKPGHLDLRTLLLNINAAKEQNGIIKPTNAGVLLFGKNPQRFILQSQLRVASFSGETVTSDFIDRLDPKGTLWEMVNRAEEFIRKNVRV